MGSSFAIRHATEGDLPRLTEIYNHYVLTTPITFDIEPYTVDDRRYWFEQFEATGPYRLFVAETNGGVAAYAGTTRFRDKRAYDTSVETTVYCAPEAVGQGLGTALYERLFSEIAGEDLRVAVGAITLPNDASVTLHKRFGFTLAGVLHDVGRKFDLYWDVAFYEKLLD